ncbi:hypothetical protein F5146DRAFT_1144073 [Armillaria mellea]|nr:hypothetical protein F5146DRAFT_1144073 [Armillaria mellea]
MPLLGKITSWTKRSCSSWGVRTIAMIISSKFHEVRCPAWNWAILLMGWWLAFGQWISPKDLQHKPRGHVINTRRQRTLYPGLVHLEACQTIHLARFEVKKTRGDELIAVDGESTAMPSDKPVLSALGVELDDFCLLLNRLLVPVKSPKHVCYALKADGNRYPLAVMNENLQVAVIVVLDHGDFIRSWLNPSDSTE